MSRLAEFGAKVANVLSGGLVDRAVAVIDKVIPDKDLATRLKHEMEMALAVQEYDVEKIAIEAERDVQVAQEATHQAELAQSDVYTKRTRPTIARQSWYLSLAYGFGTFISKLFVSIPDISFEWEVYIALAAPALTYMGVRSFDIWRSGGAKVLGRR